jgi:uncharacterized protein (TIGR02996 family)
MGRDATAIRAAIVSDPRDQICWDAYADWLGEGGNQWQADLVREAGQILAGEGSVVLCCIALRASMGGGDAAHDELLGSLRTGMEADLREELGTLIREHEGDLMGSDEVSGAMADTNAAEFDLGGIELGEAAFYPDRCEARFTFTMQGEMMEDRVATSDTLAGSATVVAWRDGMAGFTDVTAEAQGGDDGAFDDEDA